MTRRPSRRVGGVPAALILLTALLAAAVPASADTVFRPLAWHATPRPVPGLLFETETGKYVRLRDFRGKVVLINIWATWCSACREEMPYLDRLQGMLGGKSFEVIAIAIDRDGKRAVEPFYSGLGLRYLRVYLDRTRFAMHRLRVFGIPESILIDRKGREIARSSGPNAWTAPPLVRALQRVIRATDTPQLKGDPQ